MEKSVMFISLSPPLPSNLHAKEKLHETEQEGNPWENILVVNERDEEKSFNSAILCME